MQSHSKALNGPDAANMKSVFCDYFYLELISSLFLKTQLKYFEINAIDNMIKSRFHKVEICLKTHLKL